MANKSLLDTINFKSARLLDFEGKKFAFVPNPKHTPQKLVVKRAQRMKVNGWRVPHDGSPWIARLFVGFSVGHVPTYGMMDLVQIVRREMKRRVGRSDSSFVYQKGVYTHHDGSEVTEDAAQVLLLNDPDSGLSKEEFVQEILELAEVIRHELQQEAVIVEIQKGGIVHETWGVDGQD